MDIGKEIGKLPYPFLLKESKFFGGGVGRSARLWTT